MNQKRTVAIGVVIYTYNRVDDARINIELIQSWESNMFSRINIAHAYNGNPRWYKKTSEDYLIQRKNLGHQKGAADLIDSGIATLLASKRPLDYIVVLAADTWLVKPDYLEKVIGTMKKDKLVVATASWGSNKTKTLWQGGMATDFFVIDVTFIKTSKLFPLKYAKFSEKYKEILDYLGKNTLLEHVFSVRFLAALEKTFRIPGDHLRRAVAEKMLYRMKEREPVHRETTEIYERHMSYSKIHLCTHHNPKTKRNFLKKYKPTTPYARKLLTAQNLTYYNGGHTKNKIVLPNGKTVEMH